MSVARKSESRRRFGVGVDFPGGLAFRIAGTGEELAETSAADDHRLIALGALLVGGFGLFEFGGRFRIADGLRGLALGVCAAREEGSAAAHPVNHRAVALGALLVGFLTTLPLGDRLAVFVQVHGALAFGICAAGKERTPAAYLAQHRTVALGTLVFGLLCFLARYRLAVFAHLHGGLALRVGAAGIELPEADFEVLKEEDKQDVKNRYEQEELLYKIMK